MLRAFIRFLDKHKFTDLSVIGQDSEAGFQARFKVQKYAFLARYYGLNHGCDYDLYRYGPYSSSITQTYYAMAECPNDDDGEVLPESFRESNFLYDIPDHDTDWLEIATTLLDQKIDGETDKDLLDHVSFIKSHKTKDYICNVFADLKQIGLLPN